MIDQFVSARRNGWARLETLLERARKPRMAAGDLEELGRLYRQVASDLAIARRDFPTDRVTRYLEQLIGRAHPAVYSREPREWSSIAHFYSRGFPQLFRESALYTVVAFLLMACPFAAAFLAVSSNPLLGRLILPRSPLVDQIERGESWLEMGEAGRGLMASVIMTNNIQVAFLALAGGVLFGLGAVFVLVNNGLHLGAVGAMAGAYGLGDDLLSFVAAHGGIELTVIFIAGGAGLRLGHALLSPGLLSRRAALAAAGHQAVRLIFGCVPLLVLAGLLEGFVSPSALLPEAKLAVGAVSTAALYLYLIRA